MYFLKIQLDQKGCTRTTEVSSPMGPRQGEMGPFDELPCVFRLARLHRGSDRVTLTYDDYLIYLGIWRDMPDGAQDLVRRSIF